MSGSFTLQDDLGGDSGCFSGRGKAVTVELEGCYIVKSKVVYKILPCKCVKELTLSAGHNAEETSGIVATGMGDVSAPKHVDSGTFVKT